MFKKTLLLAVALIMVLSATMAFAANLDGGNARKGKRIWKKYHTLCADGSTVDKMGASTKTQSQWKEAFTTNRDELPCGGKWKKIKPADEKDVFKYLYDHALDSDQPETCG
jgi:hypothetical protein